MTSHRIAAVLLVSALALPAASAGCATAGSRAAAAARDDATITARVKTALLNQPNITVARIDVETEKGVVTLSGQVRTPEERDQAIAAARKVEGVSDVKSALIIQP
jgi:osmotically-inducible protein OsmY